MGRELHGARVWAGSCTGRELHVAQLHVAQPPLRGALRGAPSGGVGGPLAWKKRRDGPNWSSMRFWVSFLLMVYGRNGMLLAGLVSFTCAAAGSGWARRAAHRSRWFYIREEEWRFDDKDVEW